jgi:hypothetical protein
LFVAGILYEIAARAYLAAHGASARVCGSPLFSARWSNLRATRYSTTAFTEPTMLRRRAKFHAATRR